MRIIMHDYGGYSFIFELSRALSQKGYEVIHIFSSASGSPSGNFKESDNLRVIDLGKNLKKVDKSSLVSRFRQESHYGDLIGDKIMELKPGLVFSSNTPLEAQKKIASVCSKANIPFVHWLQDILSIAAENVIRKKSQILGAAVGMYFRLVEKRCMMMADHVVAISDDFSAIIKKWGIPSEKISVVENWSDITAMPVVDKRNDFAAKHELQETFNIVYSGTLGMKQNPEVLIEIAKRYKDNRNIRVVVVAAGSGVPYLSGRIREEGLENIVMLPLQPFEKLPEVLGSGDLLVAMLEQDASVYCVPSKILTYYCAGKSSLLILSKANLAARMTIENQLGFVVEPGDIKYLESVINNAFVERSTLNEMGARARSYAEKHFRIDHIVGQFLPIIEDLTK